MRMVTRAVVAAAVEVAHQAVAVVHPAHLGQEWVANHPIPAKTTREIRRWQMKKTKRREKANRNHHLNLRVRVSAPRLA